MIALLVLSQPEAILRMGLALALGALVGAHGIRPRSILVSPYDSNQELIEIRCAPTSGQVLEKFITGLRTMPGLIDIELDRVEA